MDARTVFHSGQIWEALYPAANYDGIPKRYERRVFRIDRVRNLEREPLDQETLQLNPRLERRGPLLYCLDLERRGERCFYAGALREPRLLDDDRAAAAFDALDRVRSARSGFFVQSVANWWTKAKAVVKASRVARTYSVGLVQQPIEIAEQGLEPRHAAHWATTFNRVMRRSAWRACILADDEATMPVASGTNGGRVPELSQSAP
jgi:hypothetical protein